MVFHGVVLINIVEENGCHCNRQTPRLAHRILVWRINHEYLLYHLVLLDFSWRWCGMTVEHKKAPVYLFKPMSCRRPLPFKVHLRYSVMAVMGALEEEMVQAVVSTTVLMSHKYHRGI